MPNNTILVVDDERKIVDLVRLYLEREGYRVLAAYDGKSALALARQEKPALIVLDWMLPGVPVFPASTCAAPCVRSRPCPS
jgi:DNA-binding response OmpR family regulator